MSILPVNFQYDLLFSSALHLAMVDCGVTFEYTSDDVPNTGRAIHAMWESALSTGTPFKVFNGANDASNLYFSPRTNELYRAVHDLDHARNYNIGRGTTKYTDEKYLNCLMAKRAYDYAKVHSSDAVALQLFFAVYHDTVGQVEYYKEHRDFVRNQRSHTCQRLQTCKGMQLALKGNTTLAHQYMLAYMLDCNI